MATLTKVTRIDRTNVDPSSVRSCSTVWTVLPLLNSTVARVVSP
jgi:hypothetical protein